MRWFLVFIISLHTLIAAEPLENKIITASDYSDFLNHVATCDPYFFYDAKMSSDPVAASILRSGKSGNYHYSLIEGRETLPIFYTNEIAKKAYSEWLQQKKSSNKNGNENFEAPSVLFDNESDLQRNDLTLRSNQQLFEIEIPSFHFSLNLRNAFSQTKNLCSSKGALLVSIATVVGLMIGDAVIRNEDETILPSLKLEDFETIADEASLGEHEPITIAHENNSISLRRLVPPVTAEGVTAPPINHDRVINNFSTALGEHALHFSEELKRQANDHGLTGNIMRQVFERIKKNHFINQLLSVEKIPIDQELHTCLKLLKKEGNVLLPEIITVGNVIIPILESPLHQLSITWNEWEQHFSLDDTHPLSAHFSPIIET